MNIIQKLTSALLLSTMSVATMAQDHKQIEVNIDTTDGKTIKTIMVDGKRLSAEEIAEMEASGQLKILHLDESESNHNKLKEMILFKSDEMPNDLSNQRSKTITKTFYFDDENEASLGFTTDIKKDGWHVLAVIKGSGADDAGIQRGDIIKTIDQVDLITSEKGQSILKSLELTHRKQGDNVQVSLERDGELLVMDVEARILEKDNIFMEIQDDGKEVTTHSWVMDDADVLGKKISVMVMNNDEMDFNFNEDDINMIFPENLGELKMFIAKGDSTAKLLGKNHKLTTLNEGLSSYFDTNGGVLVLNVAADNAFDLLEGDVIKTVNGHSVNLPKDVIKELLKADVQEDIKMQVIRHKQDKMLKFNK